MVVFALTLVAFSLSMVALFFALLYVKSSMLVRRLKRRTQEMRARMADFEHRLDLINTHALDHANAMTPDGTRALYLVRQTMTTVVGLLSEVEELIDSRDILALEQAESMLTQTAFSCREETRDGVTSVNPELIKLCNWTQQVERYLQLIGRDVSRASLRAKKSGFRRSRGRSQTTEHLIEAGIFDAAHPAEEEPADSTLPLPPKHEG